MTYADQATAVNDEGFRGRVFACATEQALIFIDDARPEFSLPARLIINSQSSATALVALVAGKPGITVDSADPDILAATQAVWPVYGATLLPEE